MRDTGWWILDTGCGMVDTGCGIPVFGSRIQYRSTSFKVIKKQTWVPGY